MTVAVLDTTLGELLLPSRVNTFVSCPAKWYFRYALGLVEPPTGTLALGRAFHSVLAAIFRQKIESKRMRAGIRRTSRRVNPHALKREPDSARLRDAWRQHRGEGQILAQDAGPRIGLRREHSVVRPEDHLFEGADVFAQRDSAFRSAVNVAEDGCRQAPFRQPAQIGDVNYVR